MENNNNKAIYIFLAIAVVMFIVVGSTLAYWTWSSTNAEKTTVSFTTTAGLSCSADGGGNITSSNVQLAPATCLDTEHAIQRTITTNVTNTNTDSAYMSLSLKVNTMAAELAASENFKYALTTSPTSCTTNVKESGTFMGATTNSTFTILDDEEFATSPGSGTYYLYIWLDEAETNNNTMNKAFSLSLTGVCTNHATSIGDTLFSSSAVMDNTSSTYVSASTGVDFSAISSNTNGKGLYIRTGTQNDNYPIYYYRGAVTNNNVLFGGFCWKIVRTTSTGGTKLIYNGSPTGTNHNQCENTTGVATQLTTTSAFNSNNSSLADVGYMYGTRYEIQTMTMTGISESYMYGQSYNESTHYLVNTTSFPGTIWSSRYSQLGNMHYTCFNTNGKCSPVYYIYYATGTYANYVTIPSGKTISGMIDEMLASSSNTTSSTIKTAIDTWYAANMTDYTNKLEDTPFCNDRAIYQLSGWSPSGSIDGYLFFAPKQRASNYTPNLICDTNDAFTVNASNGNGKLTYPVGLLAADEMMLAGGRVNVNNTSYYLYTNQVWWTMSPYGYTSSLAYDYTQYDVGYPTNYHVANAHGVRPVVSLKPNVRFATGGDGTPTNPYVVE